MSNPAYEIELSKWAFSKMKPHLLANSAKFSLLEPKDNPKQTHVLVSFAELSQTLRKNIADLADCLADARQMTKSIKKPELQTHKKAPEIQLEDYEPPVFVQDTSALLRVHER